MFDEKSRSSLEKVSIQGQFSQEKEILHLVEVLNRSRETLTDVTIKISESLQVEDRVVQLVTSQSKIRSLVVWDEGSEADRTDLPLSRLVPPNSKLKETQLGRLQLLWVSEGVEKVDSKHLNSLLSFAQVSSIAPQGCRKLISSFSETVLHLRLAITIEFSTIEPLFCPNLKIFEGWVVGGISSFFDAPQLQILILEAASKADLGGIPPSVEEIWLRSRIQNFSDSRDWEPLLHLCPKLRILKLMEDFVGRFTFRGVLEMLRVRKNMVQEAKGIDGIKIVPLQKLILPTSMLSKEELERAAEVVEEVIDVKDYPEVIEIEY